MAVQFSRSDPRLYTYQTRLDLVEGDVVVVERVRCESYKTAVVARVDEVPQLDADSNIEYKWVVCKVDLKPYMLELMEEGSFKTSLELSVGVTT